MQRAEIFILRSHRQEVAEVGSKPKSASKASSLHLFRYLSQAGVEPFFLNQGSNAQVGKHSDSEK